MKKFFIICVLVAVALPGFSQVRFGLRFAPNLSLNRVIEQIDTADVKKNGIGMRFSFGPTLDFQLGDHVAFGTGLWFTSKRSSIEYKNDDDNTKIDEPVFGLHYIQIPVSVKYYTNNVTDAIRIYFQVGGTADVNIAEKIIDSGLSEAEQKDAYQDVAKLFDAEAYVGAGVELKIGATNVLFGGINYNRGLVNIVTKDFVYDKKDLQINNDLLSLEMGIKF